MPGNVIASIAKIPLIRLLITPRQQLPQYRIAITVISRTNRIVCGAVTSIARSIRNMVECSNTFLPCNNTGTAPAQSGKTLHRGN
jgi:hypothetical protein